MGGKVADLPTHIQSLESKANSLGLILNPLKCEIIGLDPADNSAWDASGLPFLRTPTSASFLGSPLYAVGVDEALGEAK